MIGFKVGTSYKQEKYAAKAAKETKIFKMCDWRVWKLRIKITIGNVLLWK